LSVDWKFSVVGSMVEIKLSWIGWLKIYEQQWNLLVCDNWKNEQQKNLIVEIGSTKKISLSKKCQHSILWMKLMHSNGCWHNDRCKMGTLYHF